ncbi:Oxidoreductase OXR1 [Psilocybe cubensis]|uniref:FAD/NAD(P)-binding domain-containing protein n=2 Tax=Psilocybe cubensis TaxID=181762 RepID=A0A8H7Y6D6_PSICU|nr:Oxidoreductase OXR1 [Psilocybe cubensis]KAH9486172.1 Oxidoreductase OXR1 [Psilocybe cubensis]
MELKFKVLVIGGAYGGLGAVTNLLDLTHGKRPRFDSSSDPLESESKFPVEITVVDERDGYVHLIGNPLALADRDYAHKIWQRFSDIPGLRNAPNLTFIQGTVTSLSPSTRTAIISKASSIPGGPVETVSQSYDYCIVATGLRRVWPTVPSAHTKAGYLSEALAHLDRVGSASAKQHGVVVIGGGAVGIEMAAELKHASAHHSSDHGATLPVTLVHSRARLLSAEPLPDKFAETAAELLKKTGVELKLGARVLETTKVSEEPELWELRLSTGEVMRAAVVITAISGQHPTGREFLPKEAVDEAGYVHIDANLAIKNLPEGHFCVGDTVKWSGIKRAGAAMWMGGLAARNIHRRMLVARGEKKAGELKDSEIDPIPPMMALAVGNEAVGYSDAEGVKAGADVRKMMFGDDLGWAICWNHMKLGEEFKP